MRAPQQITDDAVLIRPADHQPHRPGWTCTQCGADWPCERYREHLLETLPDRSAISSLMAGYYPSALVELGGEPEVVHARLFAWARHEGVRRPPGGPW